MLQDGDVKRIVDMMNDPIVSDEERAFLWELWVFEWDFKIGYFNKAYVLEIWDVLAGFVQVECNTTSRTVNIKEIYIDKPFRKRWHAKEFIEEAKKFAESFDIHVMTLNVYDFNQVAIEAYKKMWFEAVWLKKYHLWYKGRHIDNIQMALTF